VQEVNKARKIVKDANAKTTKKEREEKKREREEKKREREEKK